MRKYVRLRFIDAMTAAFILANIAYIVVMRGAIESPRLLVRGYLACLAATALIVAAGGPERRPAPRGKPMKLARWLWGFVREAYPLALFPFFFVAVTRFDTALVGRDLDPLFAAVDTFLFGSVPSASLQTAYPSFLLSELLHGAYVMYYVSIPGLALWLYIRNGRALPEYIAVAMFIFYAACLTYAFVPVVGGRFDPAVRALTETYRYGPFTRTMTFIYRGSAHEGAAFPSTHAIISLVIALFARRSARPLAPVLCVNAALVFVATIYCGYHYVVDLFAALAYVAALYPLGRRLYASSRLRPADIRAGDENAA